MPSSCDTPNEQRNKPSIDSAARIKRAIRLGWDEMSADYQGYTRISLDDVHYAPLCPGERDLQLIGDVHGLYTLELACGAAQNSIALAKQGAHATALDLSAKQLTIARNLTQQASVNVELLQADMENLRMFPDGRFHIVLSCFGCEFLPDLARCLAECARVLKRGGLLIVGTVHPLTAFEWDTDESVLWVTDYFNPPVEVWQEPTRETHQKGLTFFRTVQEMFSTIRDAGFAVERIVEPHPYPVPTMSAAERQAIPYGGAYWESQYERLSKIPFAIIYKARKPE